MKTFVNNYIGKIQTAFLAFDYNTFEILLNSLKEAWKNGNTVFLCGNGGSAGNAIHLANDFNYGIDKKNGVGLKVDALPANQSIVTCIANDEGYEHIYSQQLKVRAKESDILIVLSGSGNSPNVVNAIDIGNQIGMKTFAILGYSGGECKKIAKYPIHFDIHDMQVSEDLQTIVGHMCMQWLCANPVNA